MKILLAGGTGYIGSHTAVELLNNGYEVVIVDNLCNSKLEVLARIEQITGKTVDFYPINICNKENLTELFQEQDIDAVIHLAGLKAVGESVEKPLEYYRNNLDATLTLLEVMEEHHVKKIVFSSSATVYGMLNELPLTEKMATCCTNPYGWTKYMIEQILKDAVAANPSLSVVLLRYFNPIGAHESGLIGEDPNGIPNNLIPYITQVLIGKRKELSIFGNDYPTHDGTGVRDYIHVVDLAEGHIAAVKYAMQRCGVDVFNLGTGRGYSVLDVVSAFEKVTGKEVPYRITCRRAGDVATCYASVEKARKKLHWSTKRSLLDMCRDSWNWQQKNPDGYEQTQNIIL